MVLLSSQTPFTDSLLLDNFKVYRILASTSVFAYVHTLTLENATFWGDKQFLNLELRAQHSLIKSSLMPKLPALRTCRLSEHIEWHYNEADALWKPTIPNPHVYEVRKFLQTVGGNYVVYFDNCLKDVLFPASP